jgi:hypothetical protein
MRFADSVCIRPTLLDRSRAAAFGLVARCRGTPRTMTAVHVAPDPSTATGLTRVAVLKQTLDLSARRGPMMTRRSAQ